MIYLHNPHSSYTLYLESGILSDMSITPDQEHAHLAAEQLSGNRGSWSTTLASTSTSTNTSSSTVILRRYKSYAHAAEAASPPESNK